MRRHIYHVLGVSPEDDLPPSHYEGLPLGDNEPVRFVWEKTVKQSKHNALVKERGRTEGNEIAPSTPQEARAYFISPDYINRIHIHELP